MLSNTRIALRSLLCATLVCLVSLRAAETQSSRPSRHVLWPEGAPGALGSPDYQESVVLRDNDPAKPRISKVTEPALELFLPAEGTVATSAVLICPGGGYAVLAYDHEGLQVAKWFAERGVAAAILKYRLPHPAIMQDPAVGPLQDAQEALRVLRRNAGAWGFPANKIGVMGFSAGGHLAGSLTTRHAEVVYKAADATPARPDFSILVYGVLSMQPGLTHAGSFENLLGAQASQTSIDRASNELRVDAKTPPCFLVHSQDDGAVPVENSLRFYAALTRQRIPAELHLHEKGGHGYGLGVNPGSPKHWPLDLEAWMRRNGWMPEMPETHVEARSSDAATQAPQAAPAPVQGKS